MYSGALRLVLGLRRFSCMQWKVHNTRRGGDRRVQVIRCFARRFHINSSSPFNHYFSESSVLWANRGESCCRLRTPKKCIQKMSEKILTLATRVYSATIVTNSLYDSDKLFVRSRSRCVFVCLCAEMTNCVILTTLTQIYLKLILNFHLLGLSVQK